MSLDMGGFLNELNEISLQQGGMELDAVLVPEGIPVDVGIPSNKDPGWRVSILGEEVSKLIM